MGHEQGREAGVAGPGRAAPAGTRRGREEARRRRSVRILGGIDWAEDVVHYVIAALLLTIAVAVLYKAGDDFVSGGHAFGVLVTNAINGVLFVIIVLELLRTVLAHFETSDLQLQPFLIIGIISAVRHILTIGARLTLQGEGKTAEVFRHSQIELGVEAGVVLALALGLVLIRHSEAPVKDPEEN